MSAPYPILQVDYGLGSHGAVTAGGITIAILPPQATLSPARVRVLYDVFLRRGRGSLTGDETAAVLAGLTMGAH